MESGIDLTKQPKGTRIEFGTLNSTYTVEVNGDSTYNIACRSFANDTISLEKFRPAKIPGSNWGGTALKKNWIGKDMCMEIIYLDNSKGEQFIVTTPIRKLKIIGHDGSWQYEL